MGSGSRPTTTRRSPPRCVGPRCSPTSSTPEPSAPAASTSRASPGVLDAAATLLADLGRVRGPVVVVIEDLQWVDDSSAAFVRFLLTRVTSERLLLVATVRTDGLAAHPRGRRLVGELGRLPSVRRLDLAPFGPQEVARYLDLVGAGGADHDVGRAVPPHRGQPVLRGDLGRRPGAHRCTGRRCATGALRRPRRSTGRPARPGTHGRALRRHLGPAGVRPDAASGRGARPRRRSTRRCTTRSPRGCSSPTATATRSRTSCCARRCVTTCSPGSAPGCTRPGQQPWWPVRTAPPFPAEVAHHFAEAGDPAGLLVWSVRAAEEAMRVQAPQEALRHLDRALAAWPSVDEAGRAGLQRRPDRRAGRRGCRVGG